MIWRALRDSKSRPSDAVVISFPTHLLCKQSKTIVSPKRS